MEHNGGKFGTEKGVVELAMDGRTSPIDMVDPTQEETKNVQEVAREGSLVRAFLLGSHKNIFGKLVEELENFYTQGE